MAYLGDFAPNQQVDFLFTSRDSTGTPSTLSGPVLSIYRDGNTTEFTTGLSLSTDFDARVGLNRCLIDTSALSTAYLEGHDFNVVFTAGQVSPTTVVGEVVGQFSLNNRWGGASLYGKLAAAGTLSTLSLPSLGTTTNDIYDGHVFVAISGAGMGQSRTISKYTGATASGQLDAALTTAVASTTTSALFPSPIAVAGSVNSIVPGTYSGVSVGLIPIDYSSIVTVGVGIVAAASLISADIRKINNVTVTGSGTTASPWGS